LDKLKISDQELDALREIGNISAGQAAGAFSQLVSRKVNLSVPQARIVAVNELGGFLSQGNIELAVHQRILGDASGLMMTALSNDAAFQLVDFLLQYGPEKRIRTSKTLTPMDEDMLTELGNILGGSYLTSLSKMTQMLFMPSVPHFTKNFTPSSLQALLSRNPAIDYAFVIFNELAIEKTKISLQVHLLPDPKTLPLILKAAGGPG